MNVDTEPPAEFDLPPAPRAGAGQVRPELRQHMARALLSMAAVACAAASVAMLVLEPQAAGVGSLFAVLSVLALVLTRAPLARLALALCMVLLLVMMGIAYAAVACGWGLGSPGLGVFGLLVCIVCAALGVRAGAALALAAVALIAAAALMMPSGAPSAVPPLVLLATQLLAALSGLAAGVMISSVLERHTGTALEREDRFSRLLALAADFYWELDDRYHLVAAARKGSGLRQFASPHQPPWETPGLNWDAETLDQLRADLEARSPFRDVQLSYTRRGDELRILLVSGEPRFDARGVFQGYWGVARDVTDIEAARSALEATETRYQELFARNPTPLLLQRDGRVIDANPAALAMFGCPDLQAFVGTDLFELLEPGEPRERARQRVETLRGQPAGTALPVSEFKLRLARGVVTVRATGVRVDTESGPEVLSIFVDDTERLAAEDVIRRSEAMLSHLVATSPDLITLTELDTGRFAMVNQAFERVSGWHAAEAIGRTADDLGVWGDGAAREAFVETLRACGSVSDLAIEFVTKNGARRQMQVSAARFAMDRREYMVLNARDVSERERERQQIEAILANASIGITVVADRRFSLVNAHYEALYGWGPGELVGQSVHVIWRDDTELEAARADVWPLLERGETVVFERIARRRDGSTFHALVRGRAIASANARDGVVWITENMTERHQHEQALARARDDAEAANRAKSAFLANTSHELRTPLNAMIGMARLARHPDISEERRQAYLEQIGDSAQALSGIISDILDLSRIDAGKLQIEPAAFDLGEQMRALHQTYTPLAQARGLTLSLDMAPQVEGQVRGDPLRLRQIVSNFVNNALKFTAQGTVTLHARRGAGSTADRVRIEVRDSGPGIDAVTRAELFKPFTQADQSSTRRYGGNGLGLSICRELARLMGGEVGVESAPGMGSVFWAELPLPGETAALPDAAPSTVSSARLEGTHVLIVEDNPFNMMIGVAMLERWGVSVEQATDGREAVVAVQRAADAGHHFDAVLMDVQMPVMGGHEATRVLRKMDAGRHLPIIALTAAALVSEREDALAAGMNDFLTKPVDANKLRETLARWSITAI